MQTSAYLDGEASPAARRALEQHLAGCEACRIILDTLRLTLRLYRGLPGQELPPAARRRLFSALGLDDFAPPDP